MDLTEFYEIRPYNDEELPQIFEELIADPAFQKAGSSHSRSSVYFEKIQFFTGGHNIIYTDNAGAT